MKVIDLLNKIANGEEVPQLIKWNGYIYDKLGCEYYMLNDRDITLFGDILDTNGKYLNDEVEIIEEDKKIEKLDVDKIYERKYLCDDISIDFLKADIMGISNKINEIIDYIMEEK